MNLRFNYIVLACFIFCLSCSSSKVASGSTEELPATALNPFGRFVINSDQKLELVSSAVHFGFSFEGTECQVFASINHQSGHGYLQYVMDGEYGKRLAVEGNVSKPLLLVAKNAGKHTVWIYKATEAQTGPIFIEKINAKKLRALQDPAVPLIEFIGNSITCGAAADASEIPCGTGEYHDHHNAYDAYGPRVARALGTNFILSSVSGIGVYRNWNSNGPTMPQVYEKVSFDLRSTQLWDFKKYTPKIVSIALGTNDFSNGDGVRQRLPFDSAEFINTYVRFIELVKSKYPAATIALLSSPMISGASRLLLQSCLASVKARVDENHPGKQVALFFFEPMQAHGCAGHPSVEDHALMASQLAPFFRKLL